MISRRVFSVLSVGAIHFALTGCGGNETLQTAPVNTAAVQATVERGVGIDPARYAGDVVLKIPADLPVHNEELPFVIYVGLNAETETRMSVNAFVDLRSIQAQLPKLASDVLNKTCKRESAQPRRDGGGRESCPRARDGPRPIFFCDRSDPAGDKQGFRWLSQGADARVTAKATGDSGDLLVPKLANSSSIATAFACSLSPTSPFCSMTSDSDTQTDVDGPR
ncbi:hypothetical protein GR183_18585 [Stappia sp. GBMRC 2046]|uniref:Lipoprotein n=1 Tax=Stappia sediminis TaxID=2692190 RepID=A0A7X3LXK9_9HYPH|nr:hypothetical protein [Stappia sediminis]MXN66925.1 hypothetical protein [Stappia sediminis]